MICDGVTNAALLKQAESRCHRLGQTRPVHVSYYYQKNTVEERIYVRSKKLKDEAAKFNDDDALTAEQFQRANSSMSAKLSPSEILTLLQVEPPRG